MAKIIRDLTTGSVPKTLLRFSLPLFLSGMSIQKRGENTAIEKITFPRRAVHRPTKSQMPSAMPSASFCW